MFLGICSLFFWKCLESFDLKRTLHSSLTRFENARFLIFSCFSLNFYLQEILSYICLSYVNKRSWCTHTNSNVHTYTHVLIVIILKMFESCETVVVRKMFRIEWVYSVHKGNLKNLMRILIQFKFYFFN